MLAKTFASICNKNLNGTFDIVGYCLVEQELGNDYDSFYLDIVDGNGNVLEHTLAPTLIPISRGVYFSRTILQDKSNNWIIKVHFAKIYQTYVLIVMN